MDEEFRKVNDEAAKRAAHVLERGFDAEAFLVYSISMLNSSKDQEEKDQDETDEIPDSGVDESIAGLLQCFVKYHNGNRAELPNVLSEIRQIISELYHTAESHDERNQICDFVNNLQCFKQ